MNFSFRQQLWNSTPIKAWLTKEFNSHESMNGQMEAADQAPPTFSIPAMVKPRTTKTQKVSPTLISGQI